MSQKTDWRGRPIHEIDVTDGDAWVRIRSGNNPSQKAGRGLREWALISRGFIMGLVGGAGIVASAWYGTDGDFGKIKQMFTHRPVQEKRVDSAQGGAVQMERFELQPPQERRRDPLR